MYVRFFSSWPVRRGVDSGLFGPAYAYARWPGTGEGLSRALWAEIDWFEANLPVPPRARFAVKSRKRMRNAGICWFQPDAAEMIAHGFVLAALLGECDVPVTKVATHRPGQILYRDRWQVVAKPEEGTPSRWG